MPIVLHRIDERLLHGQVLVGWGNRLGLRYFVVVDDVLAVTPWERELYAAGVAEDVKVWFLGVEEAKVRYAELDGRPDRGGLLTRSTRAMRELAESGILAGRSVNLGGIHARPGRSRVADYLYLGVEELEDLRTIAKYVKSVSARDLPTSPRIPLARLLHAADNT